MSRTAFSSRVGRDKVLIGACLLFAMTKEQYNFSLINWNLRSATAPYGFSDASQKECSSVYEAL